MFDNKRKFNLKTNLFGTNSPRLSDKKGFRGQIQLSELRGKFRFQLFWTGIDKYYNQNELGFFNLKNAQSFRSLIRYRIEKENKIYGTIANEGVFLLTEYEEGEKAGVLEGKIIPGGEIKGTWSTPDGEKWFPFYLVKKSE